MEVPDPKKSQTLVPPGSLPASPPPAANAAGAESPAPDPASAAFDILRPPAHAPGGSAAPQPENIVAEIVDQITEKQSRSARQPRAHPAAGEGCAYCLQEGTLTSTPYRVALKCTTDDSEP
jgi:hypothetical protein